MTYILSFMDKVALSEASIFGIEESDVSSIWRVPRCQLDLTDAE